MSKPRSTEEAGPLLAWASDNFAPAHPAVLSAVQAANEGYAIAYGGDPLTKSVQEDLLRYFPSMTHCCLVANGTGANVLALRLALKPWESVLCSEIAHIACQESGSAEALVGAKLIRVPTTSKGVVTVEELDRTFQDEVFFGRHATRPGVVSITQPTELGAIYSLEALAQIRAWCTDRGLLMHVDGCRLWNAAAALNVSLHEASGGCDLLSIGVTKLGAMMAEALLVGPKVDATGMLHLQKQMLQLLSKSRFVAAQFQAMLQEDLWRTLAETANARTSELAAALTAHNVRLVHPPETNQLFVQVDPARVDQILKSLWVWPWDRTGGILRCVGNWSTTQEDVTRAVHHLSQF